MSFLLSGPKSPHHCSGRPFRRVLLLVLSVNTFSGVGLTKQRDSVHRPQHHEHDGPPVVEERQAQAEVSISKSSASDCGASVRREFATFSRKWPQGSVTDTAPKICLDQTYGCVVFSIRRGRVYVFISPIPEIVHWNYGVVLDLFRQVVARWGVPAVPDVDLHLSPGDIPDLCPSMIPCFGFSGFHSADVVPAEILYFFSKTGKPATAWPNPYFLQHAGFRSKIKPHLTSMLDLVLDDDRPAKSVPVSGDDPWFPRRRLIYWRGTLNCVFHETDIERCSRLRLLRLADRNPDLFDVAFVGIDESAAPVRQLKRNGRLATEQFRRFFAHADDFSQTLQRYRYVLNVDGAAPAMSWRGRHLFGSGAVVLIQDSPFREHFYADLEAWRNFVPVATDLSDLVEKVRYLESRPEEAERIARSGLAFGRAHLSSEATMCYALEGMQRMALAANYTLWSEEELRVRGFTEDVEFVDGGADDARSEEQVHDNRLVEEDTMGQLAARRICDGPVSTSSQNESAPSFSLGAADKEVLLRMLLSHPAFSIRLTGTGRGRAGHVDRPPGDAADEQQDLQDNNLNKVSFIRPFVPLRSFPRARPRERGETKTRNHRKNNRHHQCSLVRPFVSTLRSFPHQGRARARKATRDRCRRQKDNQKSSLRILDVLGSVGITVEKMSSMMQWHCGVLFSCEKDPHRGSPRATILCLNIATKELVALVARNLAAFLAQLIDEKLLSDIMSAPKQGEWIQFFYGHSLPLHGHDDKNNSHFYAPTTCKTRRPRLC